MAPSSQLWKGICADLTMEASTRNAMGTSRPAPEFTSAAMLSVPEAAWAMNAAMVMAPPPMVFSTRARRALAFDSGVPSWPMRKNEQSVVHSQRNESQARSSVSTRPFMMPRNATRKKKKRLVGAAVAGA